MTEVVAALIRDGERFLICQRPIGKSRALLWEFAGGKVEPGETRERALVRECREELDVGIAVGGIYKELVFEYPDLKLRLTLFEARIERGAVKRLEHADIRWITAREAENYPFCPADVEILDAIRSDPSFAPDNKNHC